MKICFIAHGDSHIGMGHIMRCLSLAKEFLRLGHAVFFISKKSDGIQRIKDSGVEVSSIPDAEQGHVGFYYGNLVELQEEIAFIKEILRDMLPDAIVLDSYNVSEEYFKELKELTRHLVYIDDLNKFMYPVDMVVNGTASALEMGYQRDYHSEKLLLGLEYNMIREEFSNLPAHLPSKMIKEVLITTGASDPYHMMELILQLLSQIPIVSTWRIHLIIGGGFGTCELPAKQEIIEHRTPPKMSDIMMKCDLAVAAGGSTLYELAASGVPTIAFAYADNQAPQIRALSERGYIWDLGQWNEVSLSKMTQAIKWAENYEIRKELIPKLQKLVDGKGAFRIAQEILRKVEKK